MKILILSFFDDNFGDMLIRTCFTQLLKVVLQNLQAEAELTFMPLKSLEKEKIAEAELIIFPGGALFGFSYLGLLEDFETVLDIAEKNDIPVVFSSLGLNNAGATDENEPYLTALLHKKCIKALSVRDSVTAFRRYAGDVPYTITPVCDPAVWAGYVYAADLKPKSADRPIVGINVVRGGLFKDNGVDFVLHNEVEYLSALAEELENHGIETCFFTNGQTLDCNTLRFFAKECEVPVEKLSLPDTAREVVQAISRFDAVAAIRMHASIISYALGVPALNLVWNPKIPDFYEMIGHPERALMPGEWSPALVAEQIRHMLDEKDYRPDPAVLMTLYRFLYETMQELLQKDGAPEMLDFETVCERLKSMRVPDEEDVTDLRLKVRRSESRYLSLFTVNRRQKDEIRNLKIQNKTLNGEKKSLEKAAERELQQSKKALQNAEKKWQATKKELADVQKKNEKMQKELNHLNKTLAVRLHKRLGRIKRFLLRHLRGKKS